MKKIIILLLIMFLPTCIVYADEDDDRYSEWSTEETGYPLEKEAIQYGYKYPIEWSDWDPEYYDSLYSKQEYRPWPVPIANNKREWHSRKAQILYTWPSSGVYDPPKKLVAWQIDIDAFPLGDYSIENYYEPKMNLVCTLENGDEEIVGKTPGRGGSAKNMSINMFGTGEYICKKVTLKMIADIPNSGNYKKIDTIGTVYSDVSFETLCYSHVTKWSSGEGWRFDEPYVDRYGEDPIIAIERKVYSHPLYYYINYELYGGKFLEDYPKIYYPEQNTELSKPYKKGYEFIGFHYKEDFSDQVITSIKKNTRGDLVLYAEYKRIAPEIFVEQRYLYDDSSIDDIKNLAIAFDDLDGDITNKIVIKEILYDNTNRKVTYPIAFDPNESDTIHVIYEVCNSAGLSTSKKVKLYILKDGDFLDLRIYDRYISKDFLYTLEENSIWKNDKYNTKLNDAISWLERK